MQQPERTWQHTSPVPVPMPSAHSQSGTQSPPGRRGPNPGATGEGAGSPHAYRTVDRAWIGGVCSGLSEHLGWSVLALRIMFVLLMLVSGSGIVIYAVLWLLLPVQVRAEAPGLESASRRGMRQEPKKRSRRDLHRAAPVALLAFGLIILIQIGGIGLEPQLFWPMVFAGAGVALVWHTADANAEATGPRHWYGPLISGSRLATVARVIFGMTLVGASVGTVLAQRGQLDALPGALAIAGLLVVGLGLVAAPWIHRSSVVLREAREERVRADERADMAAHLHDSVLQTLALIQRQADDPRAVATLARRQERELRTWLYGDVIREESLKAALEAAAAEVDDEWGVPIELVCVGDVPLTGDVEALIRAGREAMVNAAKHSGAGRIDVFAEVVDEQIELFVRDRGSGFVMDDVAEDRQGVRGSIIDRIERHGGRAEIRSAPGEGTEVRLFLPVPDPESSQRDPNQRPDADAPKEHV